jgi:CHAT domain-containing protein/tetratricopeptide (TPR) repeat protein
MRLKRFFWIAPTTILVIVSQTFRLNFPVPFALSPVVAQTSDVRKAEADRLFLQGAEQYKTSQFRAAIQYWQQALAIYREIGKRVGEFNALVNLGQAYDRLGDYAKAIEYYQQSLTIAKSIGARQLEGIVLANLGDAYVAVDDYAKAIEYSQQSLAIARERGDREQEGKALGNLGLAYIALGDYAKAIECSQQSLAIAREIGNRKEEGVALAALASAYLNLGNYAKAIEYGEQTLVIAREIGNRKGEGAALRALASSYLERDNYAKAIEYEEQALTRARELGDRKGERQSLGSLGSAYQSIGDYAKAIEYFQQSLAIAKGIGDHQGEGQSLGNLGLTYFKLGAYARAIKYHQQSLVIYREIGDRLGERRSLGNLGDTYYSLGDYTKTIDYHQQSLAIAREIGYRLGEGRSLGSLGVAYYSLGDYAKAIDYQKQSLAIKRQIGDLAGEAESLNNLGVTLLNSGNLPEAERILSMGIEKWEEIRDKLGKNDAWKVSIFEQQARTYLLLQQVLIAQNKTDAALAISERGRTRAFVELLAGRLSPQSDTLPPIKHPSLEDVKTIARQQNATLVEYSIAFDEELYIWVISPNGNVTFRQLDLKSLGTTTGGSPLRKLVAETLESLGVGEDRNGIFEVNVTNPTANPEHQTKSLKQLHQVLIQPIADLLPSNPEERIIFIPHEDLFRVPFPALMDSDSKYLVEKHTILTAPSIQVLELTYKQRQNGSCSGQGALVVGNPSPMPTGFQPLKGAEKEALDVAQLLKTQPLIGSQATELAVLQQLPNARIIHLATHGTFNEQQPLLGGVALAQTGKETQSDGLLTAEEIFKLNSEGKLTLNAELLVLSACNTGRGRITGDGVIGLSRSFIAAGIPSVLVSLWAVPDAPTASLMSEFYTNLYQKKLDKAQALRQAMLKMMEKHRDNPRAWAAFTLIGEAQ